MDHNTNVVFEQRLLKSSDIVGTKFPQGIAFADHGERLQVHVAFQPPPCDIAAVHAEVSGGMVGTGSYMCQGRSLDDTGCWFTHSVFWVCCPTCINTCHVEARIVY